VNAAARKARAQLAAHTRWATCDDRTAATRAARDAAWDRWLRQVDPDGVLHPVERAKRARNARAAAMARMALARHSKNI